MPLIQLPQVQNFVKQIPQHIPVMHPDVQIEVCGALLCVLLIPVGDPKQINWDDRFSQTKSVLYIPLFKPYLQQLAVPEFSEKAYASSVIIQQVKHITTLLSSMFQRVYPMEKRAKQILYETSKEVIQATLLLFRTYLQHPQILKLILKFFLELFRSLRSEVGTTFAQQTIG